MPYFVAVGVFLSNKGGIGSRGWHIWRKRSHVYCEFEAVDIVNGERPKKFRWIRDPMTDWPPLRLRTPKRAIEKMRSLMTAKMRPRKGHPGYVRLPRGHKILPALKA